VDAEAAGEACPGAAEAGAGAPADGETGTCESGDEDANAEASGVGDAGGAIVTGEPCEGGLPAGSTTLPRIWSPVQAENTDAWSVVSGRAVRSPTCQA
jgi:hypothetical protein